MRKGKGAEFKRCVTVCACVHSHTHTHTNHTSIATKEGLGPLQSVTALSR